MSTVFRILSLIGLALMAFSACMGALFIHHGSLGAALAIGLGSLAIAWMLFALAVKARKADFDFNKWRNVEIGAVVALVLFLCVPGYYAIHFYTILFSRTELTAMAEEDTGAIRSLFSRHEETSRRALDLTSTGMANALGQPQDNAVASFMANTASAASQEDIDRWIAIQRSKLLGNEPAAGFGYRDFREHTDSLLDVWMADVRAGNLLKLSTTAGQADEIADIVAGQLTAKQATTDGQLPVIRMSGGTYVIDRMNQSEVIPVPDTQYAKAMSAFTGCALAFVAYGIVVLLILSGYFFTFRSLRTRLGEGAPEPVSGGMRLGGR